MTRTSTGGVLYHFSESGGIDHFVPRPLDADPGSEPRVWAVDRDHSVQYLLPRECPRVCFAQGRNSLIEDVDRLLTLTTARRVIAVEALWLDRIRSSTLFRYHLPAEPFLLADPEAGYWVTAETVVPLSVDCIVDPIGEIAAADCELRITPSLWPLYDVIVASTLEFSMIRMRNAAPRVVGR